jgi:tetratricopeptide (TPR) repeat protein
LWRVAAAGFVLVAVTGLCLAFRQRKYLLTGWLWFLGTLVPVIGIVQVGDQGMADRYGYIPLIGLFLMITWAAAELFDSLKVPRFASATLAAAVLVALSVVAHRQIGYWSSAMDLWSHTLAVTTKNSFAHRHLGWALMVNGQNEKALSHFREAVMISPTEAANYINLGLCLQQSRQPGAALEQYQRAAGLTSDPRELAVAYTNAGAIYDVVGDYPDAHESYNRAVQANPKFFSAYLNRGLLFEREGNVDAAITDFQRSVELQPTARGYQELGRALHFLNRTSEAEASYENARKIQAASAVNQ